MFDADKARRRYQSEDLHTRARRFGTPISFAVTLNQLTARRQLEVVVHTQYFRPSAPPFVLVIELRRLAFWLCVMLLITSAGAFRVMPRGPIPRSALSSSLPSSSEMQRPVAQVTADDVAELSLSSAAASIDSIEKAKAPELGQHFIDEAAIQMGNVGQHVLGADAFDAYTVSSQVLSLAAEGEWPTVEKVKLYFSRACLSALMHKVVGTGVTLASCMMHLH